ncbi:MAG TPA: protein TolR, partial [Methylophilaceae bacterium]|nr:protein TolR [Methylophilaceae bacterium]
MNRTRKRRMMNQINVVPYIDVTLVLLVIFMVTAPMTNPGVVDLPKVGQALKQTGAPIVVTIKVDGTAEMEGKRLERDELLAEVKRQIEKSPRAVVVAADEK